jgi:HAD superfamily hydrolase (TIGR01509 family)
VDAVIFDMDGLLLNTETLAREALHLAGTGLGLRLEDEFCASLIGVPVDACRRLLLERYGASVAAEVFFAEVARQLEARIEAGAMQLKTGVLALLAHLEQAGLPRAVATSSARGKALHHLEKAGIARRFDAIVTRDDVARGKPFPDLFLLAARRLGVPPGRCLALEDSHNGVRAAHAAGMPVVMVPDLLAPTSEMHLLCHSVVDDLHDVVALLQADGPARG